MANRRVLIKRRKAVRNIRKITRTMQLIATARFQAALNRATASKPYTDKLAELVSEIALVAEDLEHPLLKTPEDTSKSAMVVITSNRGLCGGYNANILRESIGHLDNQKSHGVASSVHMVGKKGINYFKFLKRPVATATTGIGDAPKFEEIEPIANDLMARFESGEIGSAYVSFMKFYSASRQRPEVIRLLPLTSELVDDADADPVARNRPDYEFSPEPEELLDELLPATVRARLYQCFIEAAVGEQIARMVAMKAATDAAGDMLDALTQKYNRARQTQITMELLDIVGGANALA